MSELASRERVAAIDRGIESGSSGLTLIVLVLAAKEQKVVWISVRESCYVLDECPKVAHLKGWHLPYWGSVSVCLEFGSQAGSSLAHCVLNRCGLTIALSLGAQASVPPRPRRKIWPATSLKTSCPVSPGDHRF